MKLRQNRSTQWFRRLVRTQLTGDSSSSPPLRTNGLITTGTNTLISQLSEEAVETVLLITKYLPILGVLRPPNLPISSVWHK